jgi:hypothetical protein
LTDKELEQLRQELYVFSDVAITLCAQKTSGDSNGSKSQIVSGCLNGIPHPEREAAEERAAILEFEGCLKKSEAERQAFGEWAESRKGPKSKPRKTGKRKQGSPRNHKRLDIQDRI